MCLLLEVPEHRELLLGLRGPNKCQKRPTIGAKETYYVRTFEMQRRRHETRFELCEHLLHRLGILRHSNLQLQVGVVCLVSLVSLLFIYLFIYYHYYHFLNGLGILGHSNLQLQAGVVCLVS